MENIIKLGIIETLNKIKSGEVTSKFVTKAYLEQIKKQSYKNAILEVFDDALEKAKEIDEKIKNNEPVGKLAGLPFVIKDNMLYKGKKATCCSKFLKNFVSPYTATAVQKLLNEGNSVTETALKLGFQDPNYFSTVFKRFMGVSPKAMQN